MDLYAVVTLYNHLPLGYHPCFWLNCSACHTLLFLPFHKHLTFIQIRQKIYLGDDLLIFVVYVILSLSKSAKAHEHIKLVYSVIQLSLNTYIWNSHFDKSIKGIHRMITYSPEIEYISRLISLYFPQVLVLVRLHVSYKCE